ncbi:hypothetical protein [Hoylesella oralis]|uniref:hypothetical protein n=1 Tax=Hoylesella oralis TaxID=28134 RepID=UPI0028E95D5E|nr:hypothetical protein [Hoylesella oralis]
MKTKILLAALGCLLLTGCWTSGDDYRATSSGRIVLRYTEQTLTCFTDLLRFTRQFGEYIRQDTPEKRDSVKELYFKYAKLEEGTDPMHNQKIYNLVSMNRDSRPYYTVTFKDFESSTWTVQASSGINGDTIFYNLKIKDADSDTWTISESNCAPKASYYFSNDERNANNDNRDEPYRYAFSCTNETWTVNWAAKNNNSLDFTIAGKGTMESYKTPKLKIQYNITEPIRVLTVGDFGSWVEDYRYYRQDNRFTHWQEGTFTLRVTDDIDHVTDDYNFRIRPENVVDISFKGYQDTYRR